MKLEFKIKICLWKRYFETGLQLTKYLIYMIGLFGLSSNNVTNTLLLGVAYGLFAFLLGWAYFRYDWIKADTEISNRFNLFVEEVRKKIGITNKRKI